MIEREMLSRRAIQVALLAFVLATLTAAWTLVRALEGDHAPTTTPVLFDASGTLASSSPRLPANLGIAISNDPFSPDRTEPEQAYRLPGEEDATAAAPVEAPVLPVVLGTAYMGAGRGFATCQLGDGRPVIVRIGDKLGDYTLKSIERGRVVFTTPAGKTLEIPALKTGT